MSKSFFRKGVCFLFFISFLLIVIFSVQAEEESGNISGNDQLASRREVAKIRERSARSARSAESPGGISVTEALGIDQKTYLDRLKQYTAAGNTYYLGTPYPTKAQEQAYGGTADFRSPNGDPWQGFRAMQCTGFVWHFLARSCGAGDGNVPHIGVSSPWSSKVPYAGRWLSWARGHNVRMYHYGSKYEMMHDPARKLRYGDIIWSWDGNMERLSDDHHIGIYVGDGETDRYWNSGVTAYNEITPIEGKVEYVTYTVIPGTPEPVPFYIVKKSAEPEVTDGNDSYSLNGAQYGIFTQTDGKDCWGQEATLTIRWYDGYGWASNYAWLNPGVQYYMKEIKAPERGYETDKTVYTVNLNQTGETVMNVSEKPKKGKIRVYKSSSDSRVEGNENYDLTVTQPDAFVVYSDEACTKKAAFSAVVFDEAVGFCSHEMELPYGTYWVREERAGKGYGVNDEKKKVTVNEETVEEDGGFPVYYKNVPLYGSAALVKLSSFEELPGDYDEYSLSNAVFGLYTDSGCRQEIGEFVTDETGSSNEIGSLPAGMYYVCEKTAPAGFYKDENVRQIEVKIGERAVIEVRDEPRLGKLGISKQSVMRSLTDNNRSYTLRGAVYGIYKDAGCHVQKAEIVIDEKGECSPVELPAAMYYIREKTAPKGYMLDTKIYPVKVNMEETVWLPVKDMPGFTRVQLLVQKKDEETKDSRPQGAATLKGARFEIDYFDDDYETTDGIELTKRWIIETDSDGKAVLNDKYKIDGDDFYRDSDGEAVFPVGTYTVREKEAPEGYLRNTDLTVTHVRVKEGGRTVEAFRQFESGIMVWQQVIRGDVRFIKYGEDSSEAVRSDKDIKRPLSGIRFHLKSDTTGAVYTIITDDDGIADTRVKGKAGVLPYDTYTVTEESPYRKYDMIRPFKITVSKDAAVYSYILRNDEVNAAVSVVKADAQTGRTIPVEKTAFQILDSGKNVVSMKTMYPKEKTIDVFETDQTGSFTLPEKLPYGQYYLREIHAPRGYLRGEDLAFEIDSEKGWDQPLVITYFDKAAKGRIYVRKSDAVSGKTIPVEGTVFEIYASSDIVTPDKTVHLKKGETADIIKTDGAGLALSKELYLGEYAVRETRAPYGYSLAKDPVPTKLVYANETTPVVYSAVNMKNDPIKGKIVIRKTDGETKQPVKKAGAVFEIRAKRDVITPDHTVHIRAGEVADVITADESGKAVSKELFLGQYEIRETGRPPGYHLYKEAKDVTLSYKGQLQEVVSEEIEFEDMPVKGKIKIVKEDAENGKKLKGAVFSIEPKEKNSGRKKDSTGNISGKERQKELIETDENGEAMSTELDLGTYLVKEVKAPQGYGRIDTVREVTIADSEADRSKDIDTIYVTVVADNKKTSIGRTVFFEYMTEKKEIKPGKSRVCDRVYIENAGKGDEYVLKSRIMVKNPGEKQVTPLIYNGKKVESETKITAEKEAFYTDVDFEVDVSELAGKEIVAYESLYKDGEQIYVHENPDDREQTITVLDKREIPDTSDRGPGKGRVLIMICLLVFSAAAAGYVRKKQL